MKLWEHTTHYAGFDWAKDHHDVIVLDATGKIVADFRLEQTAGGWRHFRTKLEAFPNIAIRAETKNGVVVERLLELGLQVFPVHPQSAKSYRQRKVPSGNKTDHVDAWELADALRLDGNNWKPLAPQDPLIKELRLLRRDEIALIRDRSAFTTQLRQTRYEYYPIALEAFDDWTMPAAWAFVVASQLQKPYLRRRSERGRSSFTCISWRGRKHISAGCKSLPAPLTLLARLQSSTRSRVWHWRELAQLQPLDKQLTEYRCAIQRLFRAHPDASLFGSLPGAGEKIARRLVAEIGDDRALFADAQALQCLAGHCAGEFRSGQVHRVRVRHQCNKLLRHTVHLWANLSRDCSPWTSACYGAPKKKGKTHAGGLARTRSELAKDIVEKCGKHEPAKTLTYTRVTKSDMVPGCSRSAADLVK